MNIDKSNLKDVADFDIQNMSVKTLNDFFEKNNTIRKNYGVDQGFFLQYSVQGLFENGTEYKRLKKKLTEIGFSKKDAGKVLLGLDSIGACSYAAIANGVFSSFRNTPALFKEYFGYNMFTSIDGKQILNSGELLLDLYLFTNNIENGGSLFKMNNDGTISIVDYKKILGMNGSLDAKKQTYLSGEKGVNNKLLNKFLNSKHLMVADSQLLGARGKKLSLSLSEGLLNKFRHEYGLDVPIEQIIRDAKSALKEGYNIDMGIYESNSKIRMISLTDGVKSVSTDNWKEMGGHAVFVTDFNDKGFIVSSWGNKYLVPFSDLTDDSFFVLSKWKLSNISSIDFKA